MRRLVSFAHVTVQEPLCCPFIYFLYLKVKVCNFVNESEPNIHPWHKQRILNWSNVIHMHWGLVSFMVSSMTKKRTIYTSRKSTNNRRKPFRYHLGNLMKAWNVVLRLNMDPKVLNLFNETYSVAWCLYFIAADHI